MNFNNLYVHWTIISNSSLASVHIDINLGTFCKIITLLDKDIWRDALEICLFLIEMPFFKVLIFLQIDHLTKFFLALILVLGQKKFQGSLYIPRPYLRFSL